MKMGTEASPDKKGGGHLFGYATCKAIQGTREKKTVFRCMEHNDDFVQITGLTSEQMERNEPVAALREMFGTSTDWDEIFNAVMEYGRCITLEKQTKTDKRIIQICLVSPDGRHLVIILWDGLAPEDTGQTKTFSEVDFASFFNHLTTGCAIYDVINDGATGNDYIFKDINKQGLVIEKKKKENIVGIRLSTLDRVLRSLV